MSPNYGKRHPSTTYRVPDWLLGGQRKRYVLQALVDTDGVRADDLVEALGVGRATAFETLRALRDVKAITETSAGSWTLDLERPLGEAIANMLRALEEFDKRKVEGPPRRSST